MLYELVISIAIIKYKKRDKLYFNDLLVSMDKKIEANKNANINNTYFMYLLTGNFVNPKTKKPIMAITIQKILTNGRKTIDPLKL